MEWSDGMTVKREIIGRAVSVRIGVGIGPLEAVQGSREISKSVGSRKTQRPSVDKAGL